MNQLIINADDFGYTTGINQGVIVCHQQGVLTSATLMVNGEAADEAARLAADNPRLGVGLHLNLTAGRPVLSPMAVPSLLAKDGNFPGLVQAAWRLSTGRAKSAELAAETRAQIERCLELGIVPTHIDSHHHLHAHPRLRAIMMPIAARAGISKMRGYRCRSYSLKALAIAAAAKAPAGASLKTPDRFSGIEIMGKKDITRALARALAAPGQVLEFMCHPGYVDRRLKAISSYNDDRRTELDQLVSPLFVETLKAAAVELISFRDL